MKKFIIIFLFIFLINVVGCSSENEYMNYTPTDVRKDIYNIGSETVELIDSFLDGTISQFDVAYKMENLQGTLLSVSDFFADENISHRLTTYEILIIFSTLDINTLFLVYHHQEINELLLVSQRDRIASLINHSLREN